MCAWQAAKHGKKICVIEHTKKIGEKIRISGGGRCNFTNLYTSPDNFLSQNPHFCKSALARFTPHDFIALLDERGITWHEKPYDEKPGNENARGQLFCDNSATDIIDMLRKGCEDEHVEFALGTTVKDVRHEGAAYSLSTTRGSMTAKTLVIASGGLSIPKIGASNFGYELAKKFGLRIVPPRAGLVPLVFDETLVTHTKPLSGVSVDAYVNAGKKRFREGLLFTHRGLSGPSILQASSYWHEGEPITIDFTPDIDLLSRLKTARQNTPKQQIQTVLGTLLPARLAEFLCAAAKIEGRMADLPDAALEKLAAIVKNWSITPIGNEGYRTAEVTLGGIDTRDISSKTFESLNVKDLYFIGEVLDVTGHLGGHNFQWAWASAQACAQAL